ncbi:MAG TPA: DUF72 domain-containing protein [Burkholderiales bacterium]|nr:DUF72 domain-containing protein [Burkholderiales bacterium]
MRTEQAPQMDLFGEPPASPAIDGHAVHPAAVDEHVRALAGQIPSGVRLGTSSWHFPGWARLVYDRVADAHTLAREGLAAYAQHPLLRCVSLDRTFYAPIPQADYHHYAEQVPNDFRFLVKAPMACTAPVLRAHPYEREAANRRFLDPAFAVEAFVSPCLAGLGSKVGALVFQFPPLGRALLGAPASFASKLHDFIRALPRGPLYAVELRDHALLTTSYLDALRDSGAVPCLGLHPRMPVASEQARETGLDHRGPLVVRWNLHAGLGYEEAKARYAPFARLVDEDILNRVALARLAVAAVRRGDPVFITANNKAEGSAPLTVLKLAEQFVAAVRQISEP